MTTNIDPDGRPMIAQPLADYLEMAVPLRMTELADHDPDQLAALGRALGRTIAERGDVAMFGGRDAVEGAAAIVTGLAALALAAEGGVTLHAPGLHWCGAVHDGCPRGRPTWLYRPGPVPAGDPEAVLLRWAPRQRRPASGTGDTTC